MAEQAASPGCAPRTGLAMLTRWLPEHPRRTEEELMAADPRIRASDEDRDRTGSLLREHHAAGRLDERMADLPAIDLYRLPDASLPRYRGAAPAASLPGSLMRSRGDVAARGRFSPAWMAAWGSWLSVSLLCMVIWVIAGASGFPWPVWVAGPLGAVLLGRWITGGHPGGGGGPR